MLLRVSVVGVVCCLLAGVGSGSPQQGVSSGSQGALMQLAQPVSGLSTQLSKRNTKDDNAALATGFAHHGHHHGHHHHHAGHHLGHGHHGHGKFFMYAHQPEHKHYEFGFKRGNDKHVVERYEKGGPHHNFKSKFRWHDKHGGHGERYWDYNHGPHHHDDGGDDGHGYHSEPVPDFAQPSASSAYRQRRKSNNQIKNSDYQKKPTGLDKKMFLGPKQQPNKKNPEPYNNPLIMSAPAPVAAAPSEVSSSGSAGNAAFNEMLGFDPFQPPEIMKDHSSVGMSSGDSSTPAYRLPTSTMPPPISKPYFSRNSGKSKNKKYGSRPASAPAAASSEDVPKLAFDLDSGRVFDEKTGKWFRLVADK